LRWKKSILLLASLTLVSAVAVPVVLLSYSRTRDPEFPCGFYLGIAAGGDVAETKRLIDATRGLVNLIVFTNLEVTFNSVGGKSPPLQGGDESRKAYLFQVSYFFVYL